MRIAYLGTSAFAAAVLDELLGAGVEVGLVVTRPDRPRGRGRRTAPAPVAVLATERELPLTQPADVNDPTTTVHIIATGPDAICVCAFGAILREPLLSHDLLNVHPSLLPRWRGAAPIERAIMAGDPITGVSIMRVTAGLDSGPVAIAEQEPIAPDDTYGSLAPRLERLGARLLAQAIERRPPLVEQQESLATYAEKIGPADRLLDPSRPAAELERRVRALHPHIGARAELGSGLVVGVRAATAIEDAPSAPAGEVSVSDGRLLLACATGALELREIQPPGGRAMPAADFLRGHAAPWAR